MHGPQWNVSGLVFCQGQHCVAVGDFGSAGHHDPVFGAMVVFLQAQAGLGLYLDALDLEAAAFVDAVVPAPWAVHFTVQDLLFALLHGELVDDVFHVLAARFAGHQHGVCGFDHHQVAHTNQRHQAAAGMNQRVVAVGVQHVAHMGVALCVFGLHLPYSVPCAEVVPAGIERHHLDGECAAGAVLHDGVVHRL